MTLQPIWLSPLSEPSWQISWRTLISRAAHPCPPALTPIEPGDTEPGQHRDTELGESPPAGTEPQLLPLQNPDRSTEPMRKTSCNAGHGRGNPLPNPPGAHRRSLGSHRHLQRDAAPREVCAGPVQGKLGEGSKSSSSSWRSWNVGSRVHSSKAINVGSWRNPGCGIKLGINVGVLGFTAPAGAEIAPIPWPRAARVLRARDIRWELPGCSTSLACLQVWQSRIRAAVPYGFMAA